MKFAGTMIESHIRDMVESGLDDGGCLTAAMSTWITLLYAAFENDEEKIIDEIDRAARFAKHGVDSGAFKDFKSYSVN